MRHRLCLWAATVLPNMSASAARRSCSSGTPGPPSYKLLEKWQQSDDSWHLRFALPEGRLHLGDDPTLPTCISVQHNGTDETSGKPKVLKKSYSPVSHPSDTGTFDLLVKAYEPRHGGGVGASICGVEPGQSINAKLKAERSMHGSPIVSRRWDRIGLVAGGTGVAPLVQVIRIVLDDPDDETKVHLLSINRREEDILMKDELDRLAAEHPDRFSVKYSLTGPNPPTDWKGFTGRGSVEMIRESLPPPADADGLSSMILVCGTDGFVDTWGGPVGRGPPKADGSKGPKIQGPLWGLLREAGYDASEVFKY